MSKGSKRRPMDERYCTPDQFRENYDRAFAAADEPVAEPEAEAVEEGAEP